MIRNKSTTGDIVDIAIKVTNAEKLLLIKQFLICCGAELSDQWYTPTQSTSIKNMSMDLVATLPDRWDAYELFSIINRLFCKTFCLVGRYYSNDTSGTVYRKVQALDPMLMTEHWILEDYCCGEDRSNQLFTDCTPYYWKKEWIEEEANKRGIAIGWTQSNAWYDPEKHIKPDKKQKDFVKLCEELIIINPSGLTRQEMGDLEVETLGVAYGQNIFALSPMSEKKINKLIETSKEHGFIELTEKMKGYSNELTIFQDSMDTQFSFQNNNAIDHLFDGMISWIAKNTVPVSYASLEMKTTEDFLTIMLSEKKVRLPVLKDNGNYILAIEPFANLNELDIVKIDDKRREISLCEKEIPVDKSSELKLRFSIDDVELRNFDMDHTIARKMKSSNPADVAYALNYVQCSLLGINELYKKMVTEKDDLLAFLTAFKENGEWNGLSTWKTAILYTINCMSRYFYMRFHIEDDVIISSCMKGMIQKEKPNNNIQKQIFFNINGKETIPILFYQDGNGEICFDSQGERKVSLYSDVLLRNSKDGFSLNWEYIMDVPSKTIICDDGLEITMKADMSETIQFTHDFCEELKDYNAMIGLWNEIRAGNADTYRKIAEIYRKMNDKEKKDFWLTGITPQEEILLVFEGIVALFNICVSLRNDDFLKEQANKAERKKSGTLSKRKILRQYISGVGEMQFINIEDNQIICRGRLPGMRPYFDTNFIKVQLPWHLKASSVWI